MNREYRRSVGGGAAVGATFAVMSWRFDPHPVEVAAGFMAVFVIFFALFLRHERKGSMMSPLWMGVFGIAALGDWVMQWFEEPSSGIALVVDLAFVTMFALLAVIGTKAWVREERERNQRPSA